MLIFNSCRKPKSPPLLLPAITETGQNTLGFLLDNKVWNNYGRRCTFMGGCQDHVVKAELYQQSGGIFEFSVGAGYTIASSAIDQSFDFYARNITSLGTYIMDSALNRGMRFIASHYFQSFKQYTNRKNNNCLLTISRFDTTNKIIAGRFNGTLFNSSDINDSVIIQDGRFDARLIYR